MNLLTTRNLVIVGIVLVALWLFARSGGMKQLPWNSSPITVPGGMYGGGQ